MPDSRSLNEQALISTVTQLNRTYRRLVDRALAVHGLSAAKALPVIFISRLGDGVRQGVLADQLGIEGPSLVRQIDLLQESGLVERRDDPVDRRAKGLYLTPTGHNLAMLTEKLLFDLRRQVLSQVSDADLALTLRTMQSFENTVHAALDTSNPTDKL